MPRLKDEGTAEPTQFGPERFLNRELSWLRFNRRVLEEATNPANPLLERCRFLGIFESNLDEFYMVRVSGLIEQQQGGFLELTPDGLTPSEQLMLISEEAGALRQEAGRIWLNSIKPHLDEAGVDILLYDELSEAQRTQVDDYFMEEVFKLCTPLVLHPAPSVPFISNRSLNIGALLDDGSGIKLARVKVPTIIPRLVRLGKRKSEFILLEDLIRHHLKALFPGLTIVDTFLFRVIRDADIEIRELEAADLIDSIEQTIKLRRFGDPVLLQVESAMPGDVRNTLMRLHELDPEDMFVLDGLLGMEVLQDLASLDKPSLRYPSFHPYVNETLVNPGNLFDQIRKADIFVHQPFDSFRSVEEFVASAASDPDVIGIKQTLYRVGSESPIVELLLRAAEAGKQVAVMVELKARFDESNNLIWARALERAGVHVTYGFAELKTHCKLCLVVRRERGGIRSYAHIGTGNYNPSTARHYTDFGLFTDDPEITQDIAELFNVLTGLSRQTHYRKILVAPNSLRDGILERIRRETEFARETGKGLMLMKMNSLVDPDMTDALYEASQAGVTIDLVVRGICTLRAGVPGLSDNVRVRSIVGRFLEHSRLYYFDNGGNAEAFIGSADLMRRNLDRRVETLVPVQNPAMKRHLRDLVGLYFRDNCNAWVQEPTGEYVREIPSDPDEAFRVQEYLMSHPSTRSLSFT